MRCVADAYPPKEPPYQIWTQSNLRQKCGCHGNLVTIVTRYVADVYRLIEPSIRVKTKELQSKMYFLTQIQTDRLVLVDSHWTHKIGNLLSGKR